MTPDALHVGQIIIAEFHEPRTGAATFISETIGRVTHLVDDLVVFTPLRVFCYVEGFRELGRRLPAGDERAQDASKVRPAITL